MLSDSIPTSYTYSEAASVLTRLGFELAPTAGGSHRKWRRRVDDDTSVIIGLVEKGSGHLKPYLIRDMIVQLQQHDLIPTDLEQGDDVDD